MPANNKIMFKGIDRRNILGTGIACFAWSFLGANQGRATQQSVEAAINALVGGKPAKSGMVRLDMEDLAEDGGNVLIGLAVESPMTLADHVKAIHLFAEGNPNPNVVSFHFSPQSGRAEVSTRIRLAKSQKIIAITKMSDGSIYRVEKNIIVTIGGCGM